jgi:hypothetical protein
MSLGDRCDEIVRLIDETLAAVAADGATEAPRPGPSPHGAASPERAPRRLSPWGRRAAALTRWISPGDPAPATKTGRVA